MLKIKNLLFIGLVAGTILPGCNPKHKLLNPDSSIFKEQSPPAFKVILETTKGDIVIDVNRDWSPNGADRFYNLVRYGYYNNTAFFRVRDKTWAQFGIAGDAKIAQAWRNKTFEDDPRKASNIRGRVAFAFKEPDGRTTQATIAQRLTKSHSRLSAR
jgi:peptidyl-prolyl cis-trans isomerase A (cyclophilin A)